MPSNPQLTRGQFAGERLFILGTGPSLGREDLEPLRGEYTWGTGHLALWPALPFMPTFYGCGEHRAYLDLRAILEPRNTIRFYVYTSNIGPEERRVAAPPGDKWYVVQAMKRIERHRDFGHYTVPDGAFCDLEAEPLTEVALAPGMSLIHSALQPAMWLGFDPIYILGFDLTLHGYVYDPTEWRRMNRIGDHAVRNQKALRVVREKAETAGRQVVNLSRQTADNILEKDTLEAVLRKAA